MKKLSFSLVFGMLMLFGAQAFAQSGNGNSLENRAVAAARSCIQPHDGPFASPYAELSGQGRCLDGGTVNIFTIKIAYSAPNSQLPYVLLPAPLTVATVVFDCDNRVSSVTCE